MDKPPGLEPPDTHYLSAAEGWLMLGDHASAQEELSRIRSIFQSYPDVLDVQWQVLLKAKEHARCLEIAKNLVQIAGGQPMAWAKLAQSFYYLGRYQDAYDCASTALKQFGKDFALHYDLACYACLLGQIDEAKARLREAIHLRDAPYVKSMACQDKDLEALWTEIATW
jgi:tetratricopeptide (TPR) repeat protein